MFEMIVIMDRMHLSIYSQLLFCGFVITVLHLVRCIQVRWRDIVAC